MDRTGVGTVCLWIWAVVFVVHGQNHYVNVARGKTYNQSSKWRSIDRSSNAANGNTSGSYPANCIHTAGNGDLSPWWEVDLGQPYPVYNIDLWARTGFITRLYPSVITVDGQKCADVNANTRKRTVACSAIMKGRTVRITRHGSSSKNNENRTLNMCEMEIWVCTDGWYGRWCSNSCPSRCQNTVCDHQSGNCSQGCKAGYTGARCAECANRYYKTNSGTCTSCSSDCLNQLCDKTSGTCIECADKYYKLDNGTCTSCSSDCPNQQCDKTSGRCSEISDGCDKETINTNAIIGSVLGGALIIGICIILGIIILKRWSVRSGENHQNNQASNDLNMSPTSPRPGAPGDKEERTTGVQAVQEQEQPYEIVEDRAKATSDVSPEASAVSDIVYQQSEADSANPYDLPTMPYYNTGDVHLYGHWSDSRAPQRDAQTARAGDSGGKGKAATIQMPRP